MSDTAPAPKRPDLIDVEVGLTICRLRKERKLSQDRLAVALGITFQQIQKYESGRNRVSASMLVKVAAALHVQPADLLPRTDAEPLHPSARWLNVRGADELLEDYGAIRGLGHRRVVRLVAKALRETGGAQGGDDNG